jgi:hypothetical protein
MLKAGKRGEGVLEDGVGGLGGELRHKSDAAGIKVETGVYEAIFESYRTLSAAIARPPLRWRTIRRCRR